MNFSRLSPRFLLITDSAEFQRLLEHHITAIWPEARIKWHAPASSGPLQSGFTAAAYSAVLLDGVLAGDKGGIWLQNLLRRPEFPPVLYFSATAAAAPAEESSAEPLKLSPPTAPGSKNPGAGSPAAKSLAPQERFLRGRIDHGRLAEVLRAAAEAHPKKQAAVKRHSKNLYRFGSVTVRGQRFVRELGIGGMASVYLAESEQSGELVVLKILKEVADSPQALVNFDRFLREYELVSQIDHPNVVRIQDLGVADDHIYLAMEYFPAGDLRVRLAQALTRETAVAYARQIAYALDAIHRVGVLHRDLKPGNVMLRTDGTLALIDFGLAKQLEQRAAITMAGEIFGTPYYMSPEQGHGEEVNVRSDLYSLGVIFYEMLMRKKPYVGSAAMEVIYLHRNGQLPELKPELADLQPIVHKLLAKAPEDRFQSAAEVLEALRLTGQEPQSRGKDFSS